MKKPLHALVLGSALFLGACGEVAPPLPESYPTGKHIHIIERVDLSSMVGPHVFLIDVDGKQYIVVQSGGNGGVTIKEK